MSISWKAILLASACVWLAGCGPDLQPGEGLRQKIVNGSETTDERHQAVVAITVNQGYGYCTGTLIAPDVVLTAAHCIEDFSRNGVIFGDDLAGGETSVVEVVERWVHPDYGIAKFWHDVGLLRLSAGAPPDVVPIPFLPHAIGLNDDDLGSELEFVGFGWTDPDLQDYGIKMHVVNDIGLICDESSGCHTPELNDTIPNHAFCHDQDPGGICMGDSGGPALIQREGKWYVAGVTSFTSAQCDVIACSANADDYEDAILDFIGRPLGEPCERNSACSSGFCTEGICCDAHCSGPCQTCSSSPGHCAPLPDGTSCDDGDACNGIESCQAASCVSTDALDCDDSNPCTFDGCQPGSGCINSPMADGTACPHAEACDGEGSCESGVCQAGDPSDCDADENTCESGECQEPKDASGPVGTIVGSCSTVPRGRPCWPPFLLGILVLARTWRKRRQVAR